MNKKVKRRSKGFTLVELVIVIAIVIILSVISVPIYRGYVDKAKMAEGYALLGAILSAQKAYYSEHGNFLGFYQSNGRTSYDNVLGIDARGNKYFTRFEYGTVENLKFAFFAGAMKPIDFSNTKKNWFCLSYNITTGETIDERYW